MEHSNQSETNLGGLKYLSQDEAIKLDRELFDECGFSVDQLMELAGLSVATAISRSYPKERYNKPIVCCGPGNNGGDGLVCARHLKLFGYAPKIINLKSGKGQLYQNLLTQCRKFEIDITNQVPSQPLEDVGNLVVDAIFGFSYKPPNRNADFARLLNSIHSSCSSSSSNLPLVSIDIPSGWHVEDGMTNIGESQKNVDPALRIPILEPDCLISLTAPKMCARHFKGKYHYLGGRFCPRGIIDKHDLNLPTFPGSDCVVLL